MMHTFKPEVILGKAPYELIQFDIHAVTFHLFSTDALSAAFNAAGKSGP
jgi:hypothetical protein